MIQPPDIGSCLWKRLRRSRMGNTAPGAEEAEEVTNRTRVAQRSPGSGTMTARIPSLASSLGEGCELHHAAAHQRGTLLCIPVGSHPLEPGAVPGPPHISAQPAFQVRRGLLGSRRSSGLKPEEKWWRLKLEEKEQRRSPEGSSAALGRLCEAIFTLRLPTYLPKTSLTVKHSLALWK